MKPKSPETRKKKPYSPPKLRAYGTVRELTQAITATMGMDGGVSPSNMVMNCVTAAPYLEEHRVLLRDPTQELFREAIFATVKPGDVVLDLGTGSGLHAFFACQAGAARVYAIEAEPVIELARAAAKRNGLAEKVHFLHGLSTELELPEKVDVILTNTGYLGILQCLPDARRRFLKPGGRIIPGKVNNWFVPIEAEAKYAEWLDGWKTNVHGFDFSDFRDFSANTPYYHHFSDDCFLAEPAPAPVIDYMQDLPKVFRWPFEFAAKRPGRLHGLMGWYEFQLAEDIRFSTKPPLRYSPYIWTQYFFPFERSVEVKAGEKIRAEVAMSPEARRSDPVWKWSLLLAGGEAVQQSNFRTTMIELS